MRKLLILTLCILFLGVTAQAGIVDKLKSVIARKNTVAYIQDFNTTTEPGGPADWSDNGVDFDNATDLGDGQSLQLPDAAGAVQTIYDPNYNEDEYTWTFWWQTSALDADQDGIFSTLNSGGVAQTYLRFKNINDEIHCYANGGTNDDSNYTISADVLYKFKVYVKQGTGENGTITAWRWDGDAWQALCNSNDGTNTEVIDAIRFRKESDGTANHYYDYVKGNPTDIISPD